MAISKEKLASIIAGNAAALCNPSMDNAKASQGIRESAGVGGPMVSDYDNDAAQLDALYSDSASEDYSSVPARGINYTADMVESSGMPDKVKKSLIENRIDTSKLGNTSVLDSMGIKPKPLKAPMQKPQQVVEQRQPAQYTNGGGVDYSIIKAIVSECIREYFSQNPINENTLSKIALKEGKIALVDNSGNVYRAKLEKLEKK
jgi:hypothetical protein